MLYVPVNKFPGNRLRGLSLICIAGVTETPAFKTRCETEEGFAESVSGAPAHRFADPLEMASVVAFLLGDDSSYLSGQPIAVSGGG